jgi:hypothetical protein
MEVRFSSLFKKMRSIFWLGLLAIVSSASAQTYEAEDGVLTGALYVDTEVPGYTGTGYVTGFTGTNDTLTITVMEATAGSYDITVVYNAQYGSKYTDISIDGGAAVQVSFPNITTETWATSLPASFEFTAGANTVQFTDDWGWYLIDSITVVPTPPKPIVSVNVTTGGVAYATDGILEGTIIDTATAGYIGTGYVTGFFGSTDSLTITLFSEAEALYDVVVAYAAIYGYKQTTLSVNAAGGSEVDLADTSTAASPWANATAGQILLNAGNNTITFTDDCKLFN